MAKRRKRKRKGRDPDDGASSGHPDRSRKNRVPRQDGAVWNDPVAQGPSDGWPLHPVDEYPRLVEIANESVARTCEGCSEFVQDGEAGRGTCMHPASGVLSPWTDTPACAFFTASRYGNRRGDHNIW